MFRHTHLPVRRTEKPSLLDDLFDFCLPRLYWRTLELFLSGYVLDVDQREMIEVLCLSCELSNALVYV